MADYPQHAYATDTSQLPCVPDPALLAAYELTSSSDASPPQVSISTPSALTSRTDAVLFEVEDESGLARVYVAADFGDRTELIYDGVSFVAPYTSSSRMGNAFTVRRAGGWAANFEIVVGAVDVEGNAL